MTWWYPWPGRSRKFGKALVLDGDRDQVPEIRYYRNIRQPDLEDPSTEDNRSFRQTTIKGRPKQFGRPFFVIQTK
jgi:hypothetical protein